MNSFYQLFISNLKIVYRNTGGLFWTIVMPSGLYIALSVLPIPKFGESQLAYSDYVLPGIVAYTIMQSGIYSLAYWLVDLKARGVIKRFLVTPLKTSELILSLITARLFVILLQVVLLSLIGLLFFGANFAGNVLTVLILTLLGGGIFLLIGLLISNFTSTYESAAPITAAIGMPFAFLGNIFFPSNSLPHILRTISKILPISYLADGLRQAYLFPFDFEKIGKDILILALWLAVILLVTIKIFKLKE